MRALTIIGCVMLIIGVSILLCYGIYHMLLVIPFIKEIPLVAKIVPPLLTIGCSLLVLVAIYDRIKQRRSEGDKLRKVDF